MPKALDLTKQNFGKLTALSKASSRSGKTYWLCQCECGELKEIQTNHLVTGAIKSCGCQNRRPGDKVVAFRKRIKIALVEAFQHKCCSCGLVDDVCMYDFHHLIPKEKEFGIGNAETTRSRQAYADEAKKCIMLCANCHRRIENDLIKITDIEPIYFNETQYFNTLEELVK